MAQSDIKQHLTSLPKIFADKDTTPLVDVLRPWMLITGLDFKDAIELPHEKILADLRAMHAKVGGVLDVLDEDQAVEAACRAVGSFDIYDPDAMEGVVQAKHTVVWEGNSWTGVSDPKLRLRDSSKSFAEARAKIQAMIEQAGAA